MSETQPTVGEIGRSVDRLEKEIGGVRSDIKELADKVPTKEFIGAIERAFQANLDATEEKFDAKIAAVESKVADLEDWKKWTLRLVLALVIAAVMGLVLVSGGSAK